MKYNTSPDFKTEVKAGVLNCIIEIENDFLQAWADAGAYVIFSSGYWIMTNIGQLWFKIEEDSVHLECIAVRSTDRKQGNGTKLMELVKEFADETKTTITLQVDNVSRGNSFGAVHQTVAIGSVKKDKIPVNSLPKWYSKFGFVKTEDYTAKKKNMIYKPK